MCRLMSVDVQAYECLFLSELYVPHLCAKKKRSPPIRRMRWCRYVQDFAIIRYVWTESVNLCDRGPTWGGQLLIEFANPC